MLIKEFKKLKDENKYLRDQLEKAEEEAYRYRQLYNGVNCGYQQTYNSLNEEIEELKKKYAELLEKHIEVMERLIGLYGKEVLKDHQQ